MSASWRLSSFFAVYFAVVGAIMPYFSLYLESLDFSPPQIGALMSILLITRMIAPNFWGYFIDKYQTRLLSSSGRNKSLVVALFLSFFLFSFLNVAQTFWWIAVLVVAYSFFWNAVLPQFEALVYNHLGEQRFRYGRIRVWGSIGFIIVVIAMGWSLDHYGIAILIPSISVLFLMLMLVGLSIKEPKQVIDKKVDSTQSISNSSFLKLLTPSIVLLLVFSALGQVSHAPFHTFFSIYLEDYGYSKTQIGWLWAWGAIAEIFVFVYAHHLLARCNLQKVLVFVFLTTAVRWWLVATYPESITLLILAQSLHAISFGLYHSTMSQIINQHFVGRNQVKGQALYSSFTFGLGGAIGSISCGFLWLHLGGEQVFLYSGVLMLFVGIAAWITSMRFRSEESVK